MKDSVVYYIKIVSLKDGDPTLIACTMDIMDAISNFEKRFVFKDEETIETLFTFLTEHETGQLLGILKKHGIYIMHVDITDHVLSGSTSNAKFNELFSLEASKDILNEFLVSNLTVDILLDKIATSGVDSLTSVDKIILNPNIKNKTIYKITVLHSDIIFKNPDDEVAFNMDAIEIVAKIEFAIERGLNVTIGEMFKIGTNDYTVAKTDYSAHGVTYYVSPSEKTSVVANVTNDVACANKNIQVIIDGIETIDDVFINDAMEMETNIALAIERNFMPTVNERLVVDENGDMEIYNINRVFHDADSITYHVKGI